jgi:hypothetical protein
MGTLTSACRKLGTTAEGDSRKIHGVLVARAHAQARNRSRCSPYGLEEPLVAGDTIFGWVGPRVRPLVSGGKPSLPKTRSRMIRSPATSVPTTKGSMPMVRRLSRSVTGFSSMVISPSDRLNVKMERHQSNFAKKGMGLPSPLPTANHTASPGSQVTKLVARTYDLA